MPVDINEVMKLVRHISEVNEMHVAIKNSGKGALCAGIFAGAGGVVGGPPGIAVGAAIGGLFGYWMTRGQFKPMSQILRTLKPNQRRILCDDVAKIVRHLNWTDGVVLISLVMGNPALQRQVLVAISGYFMREFNAEVRY